MTFSHRALFDFEPFAGRSEEFVALIRQFAAAHPFRSATVDGGEVSPGTDGVVSAPADGAEIRRDAICVNIVEIVDGSAATDGRPKDAGIYNVNRCAGNDIGCPVGVGFQSQRPRVIDFQFEPLIVGGTEEIEPRCAAAVAT